MLPIALGDATKTVPYVMDGRKIYEFTVAWGEERATDDLEGEVTRSSDKRPDEAADPHICCRHIPARCSQVPPQFSAIKIAGERAYDLARDGETVEIPAREVEIFRLTLHRTARHADIAHFEVECGKGTYVRALARDFGRELGCYGHIVRRCAAPSSAPFARRRHGAARRSRRAGSDRGHGRASCRARRPADRHRRSPVLAATSRRQRRPGARG